jgi:hypothetical protein
MYPIQDEQYLIVSRDDLNASTSTIHTEVSSRVSGDELDLPTVPTYSRISHTYEAIRVVDGMPAETPQSTEL